MKYAPKPLSNVTDVFYIDFKESYYRNRYKKVK